MIYDEPTMKEVCEAFNLKGVHPAANLFPLVTGDEFQALCQSIGKDGLEEPVVLTHDGLLLDGRNRLRALLVTGSTERFKTLDETYASDNYIGYVLRLNLHRRHLSASQKAALAVDVEKLYADLAKERQVRTAENRAKVESLVPPILAEQEATEPPPFELSASVPVAPKLERWQEVEQWKKENPTAAQIQPIKNRDNESAVQAAKATGASAGYVKDAKAIAAKSPEMFEQVKAGTVSIPEAKRVIEIQEQSKPKFRGQFATIETWGAMSPDDQSAFLAQRDDKFKFNKQGDTAADSMGSKRLERYGSQWQFQRIAVLKSDTPHLPAFDAATKSEDLRYTWFVENYGHQCWELDAIDPNDLRQRVREQIETRLNLLAWEHAKTIEAVEVASMKSFHRAWNSRISQIGGRT